MFYEYKLAGWRIVEAIWAIGGKRNGGVMGNECVQFLRNVGSRLIVKFAELAERESLTANGYDVIALAR